MSDTETAALKALLIRREGRSTAVYGDSLGKLTVGIGHRVNPSDTLRLGDTISAARVDALLDGDAARALAIAQTQAATARITDAAFITALASVVFQLGACWTTKFPNTWRMIQAGHYAEAAAALNGTSWRRQTPLRVADFQTALRRLEPAAA